MQKHVDISRYLSPGSAKSLKKPTLPMKPCRVTSALVGKAYQAAGKAGTALHTMAVLQAYQADLLKDLSAAETIDKGTFDELRRATDLSLRPPSKRLVPSAVQCLLYREAFVVESFRH